jgi:hypothetical protein
LSQHIQDHFDHSLDIFENFVIPEPEHPIAASFQIAGSCAVVPHVIRMLTAIKLYDDFSFQACEIENVIPKRVLPSELATLLVVDSASIATTCARRRLGHSLTFFVVCCR